MSWIGPLFSLLVSIVRNPSRFRSFLVLLIFILLLGVDKVAVEIEGMRKQIAKGHDRALTAAYVMTTAINDECSILMDSSAASRCYVFLFHNGTSSFGGVPFLKMTNTHETVSKGISPEIANLRDMPLREIITWLPDFLEHKCHEQIVAQADPVLKALLEAQGIARLIVCPIFFPDRMEPVGYVGLDFNRGWEPSLPEDRLQSNIIRTGGLIAKHLVIGKAQIDR